jgi:hypothetical protein
MKRVQDAVDPTIANTSFRFDGAANTAIDEDVVAANAEHMHCIKHLYFSCNKTPAEDTYLEVKLGTTSVFKIWLASAGPGPWPFPDGLFRNVLNEKINIICPAAGTGCKIIVGGTYR